LKVESWKLEVGSWKGRIKLQTAGF